MQHQDIAKILINIFLHQNFALYSIRYFNTLIVYNWCDGQLLLDITV